jgi:hypothetical protein
MLSKTIKWEPGYRVDVFTKYIMGKNMLFIRTTTYMRETCFAIDECDLVYFLLGRKKHTS